MEDRYADIVLRHLPLKRPCHYLLAQHLRSFLLNSLGPTKDLHKPIATLRWGGYALVPAQALRYMLEMRPPEVKMQAGDRLVSSRGLHTHHGICVGNNQVIHYGVLGDGRDKECVQLVSLKKFEAGRGSWVERHLICTYTAGTRVKRARSRLGEDDYNVVFNNCEHFVNWCFDGFGTSSQMGTGNLSSHIEDMVLKAAASMISVVGPTATCRWMHKLRKMQHKVRNYH